VGLAGLQESELIWSAAGLLFCVCEADNKKRGNGRKGKRGKKSYVEASARSGDK
jgi:hypothetical protein